MTQNQLLRMNGISKAFSGSKALDDVTFEVFRNEVLALVGENGAGKSTLMKILTGVYQKDAGSIFFEGKEVEIVSPHDAHMLGISIIHQELNLMENLSIVENIFIGRESRKYRIGVDTKKHLAHARELLERVGLKADPNTKVGELSIAQRQMVEIAKSLAFNAKLIIMDEPTSSLTKREIDILMDIIRKLCSDGVSIVFISHRLDEVFDIAHRITVLRDGCTVGTMDKDKTDTSRVISLMVGREITDIFPKTPNSPEGEALKVEGVSTKKLLRDISFSVKKGEILGFAGLVGAGRSELMNVIFGLDTASEGKIYVDGKKVRIKSSRDAIRNGIGFVPEDRKKQGLILHMTVRENTSLPGLKRFVRFLFLQLSPERNLALEYIEKLSIRTPGTEQVTRNLSGGNQQKIVLSKWLALNPNVLILDEPTRGVDVGAKKEIHTIINSLAKEGIAIIMISSELPEILGMSDRIIVMHEGRVTGELQRDEATQESILRLAVS